MNNRLEQFMRSEQLSAAKLAEILQIQPSSISHLLSGRNKPSFEFISRIMKMFPELNPDWLINNEGSIYRTKMMNVNTMDINPIIDSTSLYTADNKDNTLIKNVTAIHSFNPLTNDLFSDNESPVSTNQKNGNNVDYTSVDQSFSLGTADLNQANKQEREDVLVNNSSSESYKIEDQHPAPHSQTNHTHNEIDSHTITPNISKVMVMYDDKTFEIFISR